jgi:hypothetical protein
MSGFVMESFLFFNQFVTLNRGGLLLFCRPWSIGEAADDDGASFREEKNHFLAQIMV